jgi:integrase
VEQGQAHWAEAALKLREIWAIRTRLQMASNVRELAMFNLAIDSKLRACDLTRLQVQDVRHGSHLASRATVMQQKTQRPVQFEITEQTRESFEAWIEARGLKAGGFSVPEPDSYIIAPVDAAICPAGTPLGRIDWP